MILSYAATFSLKQSTPLMGTETLFQEQLWAQLALIETIYTPYGDGNSIAASRVAVTMSKQSTPLLGTVLPFSDKTLAEKSLLC